MKQISFLFILMLTGCAQLQEIDTALSKQNSTPVTKEIPQPDVTRAIGAIGDGTGYQPDITITIPGAICDKEAYVWGFKDEYVSKWNPQIVEKRLEFRPVNSRKGASAVTAKKNLAMYASKHIGNRNYVSHAGDYGLDASFMGPNYKVDSQNKIIDTSCPHKSYNSGGVAGAKAVQRDWQDLVAHEI